MVKRLGKDDGTAGRVDAYLLEIAGVAPGVKLSRSELLRLAVERLTPAGSKPAPKRRLRRAGPGERVTVLVPPDLLKRMRFAAVSQRRSLSDAAAEAVRLWLDGKQR